MPTRREFLCAAGAALAPERLRLKDIPGEKVVIRNNGVTVLEYRYAKARPKPYIHPLCLPDGTPVSLDGPKDHIHHRGLMTAWSEVNGIDFWGEDNPARHGQIVHQKFERLAESPAARISSVNHWVAEGKLLLVERRTITVPEPSADGVWIEWAAEMWPAKEPVTLAAGEHVYNGLGIRVVRSMNGGRVLNSRGSRTIEKVNGEAAEWCAYTGGGKNVAFFDHPSNPRHPNAFFVMNQPFGYMSAAPTFREPFQLAPGQSIRFTWGVLTFSGASDADRLGARFRNWSQA